MSDHSETKRFLLADPPEHLTRPLATMQPVLAREGRPTVDIDKLTGVIEGCGRLEPMVPIQSPDHWAQVIGALGADIDAILPVSIPAYPTEIWNSHPQPLIDRGLPVIFWPLIDYDEPDFWRWSARDFLRALGVEVHIARNNRHGRTLLKALATKRLLAGSKIVLFGEQNFPWNATAAGHLITESVGLDMAVRPLADIRARYEQFSDEQVDELWQGRKGQRYVEKGPQPAELRQAIRTYLAIRSILQEERAIGFGVNCFGDLVIGGDRDVPCLAQVLLREEGYIASCDGDYVAMLGMILATFFLDRPCMMSNMYPVSYVGALRDHFGDPLSPDESVCPRETWGNLARLAHCGFVGVISPEMTPTGKTVVTDWGGTYEIKRDGRGCGLDGDLAAGQKVTVIEPCFDGRTLLLAGAEVCQTTRHPDMPHCESSVLLRFGDLEGFVGNISREHTVIVYGDHIEDLKVLGGILGMTCKVF